MVALATSKWWSGVPAVVKCNGGSSVSEMIS